MLSLSLSLSLCIYKIIGVGMVQSLVSFVLLWKEDDDVCVVGKKKNRSNYLVGVDFRLAILFVAGIRCRLALLFFRYLHIFLLLSMVCDGAHDPTRTNQVLRQEKQEYYSA